MFRFDRYDSVALESFDYFGFNEPSVALEGFNIPSIIGILATLVEKIKNIIGALIKWAGQAKEWFRLKLIKLLRLKYVEIPEVRYKNFKIATDGFLDILRFVTYVVPQLVATKFALFGKIGKAIETRAKGVKIKLIGNVLSEATRISDTLTKIAEETTRQNLAYKLDAFTRFKNFPYPYPPNTKLTKVPISQLKFYAGLNQKVHDTFEVITETFQDIRAGITDMISTLRGGEDGAELLSNDQASPILESVTKFPMILGRVSNMMVVMTSNAMIMINIMLQPPLYGPVEAPRG